MSSPITAVFEATIGLLVNEGRDELAEKLNEGDVTDQKFRDLTVFEIDEVKLKLDSLARKDFLASSSRLVKEGIELLYEVFESASSSEHRVIKAAAIACAGQFNIVKETRKLDLTALDESAMRKLSGAKKRFVEARCRATELFWNEALKLCDRLSAMACRLVVTILEMIDNPTDALEACRVCLDELHQLPGVKECFKVELEGGLRACLYKEQRRQTIFSVYRLNRLVYDVMSMLGSVKRWTLPYVETGKEKVDPLRNERVLKVLKHHCVTPWALGQEAKEELKDPRGIATNSKGHFLIADNGDKTVKVFDNNGKFGFRFNPRTDDADTKLDILDVATAGEDEKIFLLVTLMKPGVEEWENEVQVFNKTADLQHRFPVWSGDRGRDKLTACGKILLLTGTWSGNVVEVYEPSGEFICRFGEGVFKDAADITATCDGCVMIVDREDQNAYLFDVKGHQLGKFNIKHERDFYYRIACHPASDHVVLAGYERETCRPAIAIYTVNGEFVRRMQLDEEVWSVNGITVTLEGHIAVALRDKHDIKVKVIIV